MKRLIALAMMGVGLLLHAELVVSDVQVFSGKPWREVAIGYTITGTANEPRRLKVQARDNVTGTTYDCTTLTGASVEPGRHVMKWNAQADDVKVCSSNVVMTVQVVPPPLYCVVDLSGGTTATSYPVTGLADVPSGGWTDEYKTSKLVLRRIEAGTFTMGGRSTDYPGASDRGGLHDVTLTKSFYIGVFEVTQRQWELVMGTKPSYFTNATYYASRPVEKVSYNMIRGSSAGAGWPANNAVDTTSFLGKLRAKTGIDFDLPTEAQWEYACRAGTTTALNSGNNLTSTSSDSNMAAVGRYYYNSSAISLKASCTTSKGTAKVGSYAPNAWGLYDMHGNVSEWCLDWNGTLSSSAATDPSGSSSGSSRVLRGGDWASNADGCLSANRYGNPPSDSNNNVIGFRLVRTP